MKPPFCAKTEQGFTHRGALFTRALHVLHAAPVYTLRIKNYTLHANPCLHRRLYVAGKFLFIRVSVNPFLGLNSRFFFFRPLASEPRPRRRLTFFIFITTARRTAVSEVCYTVVTEVMVAGWEIERFIREK
jgi:hypothetical protein